MSNTEAHTHTIMHNVCVLSLYILPIDKRSKVWYNGHQRADDQTRRISIIAHEAQFVNRQSVQINNNKTSHYCVFYQQTKQCMYGIILIEREIKKMKNEEIKNRMNKLEELRFYLSMKDRWNNEDYEQDRKRFAEWLNLKKELEEK